MSNTVVCLLVLVLLIRLDTAYIKEDGPAAWWVFSFALLIAVITDLFRMAI